eukprot:13095.XXX_824664_824798_1 [CDS] Oithona nana genome sequencing.
MFYKLKYQILLLSSIEALVPFCTTKHDFQLTPNDSLKRTPVFKC